MTSSAPAIRERDLGGDRREVCVERRRRGDDLGADAVGLHRLDDGPRRGLAGRAAGDEHGELADEVDLLLEEQAALDRAGLADRGEPLGDVVRPTTRPRTPLPS